MTGRCPFSSLALAGAKRGAAKLGLVSILARTYSPRSRACLCDWIKDSIYRQLSQGCTGASLRVHALLGVRGGSTLLGHISFGSCLFSAGLVGGGGIGILQRKVHGRWPLIAEYHILSYVEN